MMSSSSVDSFYVRCNRTSNVSEDRHLDPPYYILRMAEETQARIAPCERRARPGSGGREAGLSRRNASERGIPHWADL
jgi:hypothetical protein